jgi:hypothetical protein
MGETKLAVTVTMPDGSEYAAGGFQEVVRLMRYDSLVRDTPQAYKDGVAWRVMQWTGHPIQFHNARTFLHELERIGVVARIEVSPFIKDNGADDE